MTIQANSIDAYKKDVFRATLSNGREISHDVYSIGEGSPVIIIQELPGIGPATLRLADQIAHAGHHVVLPHLFGPIGKLSLAANLARVFCMRKEFAIFSANGTSPVTEWLKALCQQKKNELSVPGVGVIGMCLTGNFAFSLIADQSVLAAVASQPSLPIGKHDSLHMSDKQIESVKGRLEEIGPMKMFRFEEDWMCSTKKEKEIDNVFNCNGKVLVEKHIIPGKGHAVLTQDFVGEDGHPTKVALDSMLDYFAEKLN